MRYIRMIADEPNFPGLASLLTNRVVPVTDEDPPEGRIAVRVFLGSVGFCDCDPRQEDDYRVFFVEKTLTEPMYTQAEFDALRPQETRHE